jgi:hypothetical protein
MTPDPVSCPVPNVMAHNASSDIDPSFHRQRPSHGRVFGFSRPLQVCPGGGVTVVSHRCRPRFHEEVARVPSSHTVCQRPRVFSS